MGLITYASSPGGCTRCCKNAAGQLVTPDVPPTATLTRLFASAGEQEIDEDAVEVEVLATATPSRFHYRWPNGAWADRENLELWVTAMIGGAPYTSLVEVFEIGTVVTDFDDNALAMIQGILQTAAGVVVNAGLRVGAEGFPSHLRIGDARTIEINREIIVRVYDVDAPATPLLQIGTRLLADAKLTLGLTRPGLTVSDVEVDCSFQTLLTDGWILIEYDQTALDDAIPNLPQQYLWGIKAEWPVDPEADPIVYTDPITIADGKVWLRPIVVANH